MLQSVAGGNLILRPASGGRFAYREFFGGKRLHVFGGARFSAWHGDCAAGVGFSQSEWRRRQHVLE